MNVYDFDGTILHGDTENFFREYVYKHFKLKFKDKLELKFYDFLWKLKLISPQKYRNHTYPYIMYIPNLDKVVKEFWDEHEKFIRPYYYKNHQPDDVVVSASPRVLLEEIIRRLKIKTLISTELDVKTGKIIGKLCRAEQKVVRYDEIFNQKMFENYYFDQEHDRYLLAYAKNGYVVQPDGELKKIK